MTFGGWMKFCFRAKSPGDVMFGGLPGKYTEKYTIVFSYFAQYVPNCITKTKQSYKQTYRIFSFFLETFMHCTGLDYGSATCRDILQAMMDRPLHFSPGTRFLQQQQQHTLWYLCQRFRDHLIEKLDAWFQVCLLQPWLLCPCSHHWKSLVWSQGKLVGLGFCPILFTWFILSQGSHHSYGQVVRSLLLDPAGISSCFP